jgi:hypothetical protein
MLPLSGDATSDDDFRCEPTSALKEAMLNIDARRRPGGRDGAPPRPGIDSLSDSKGRAWSDEGM